MYMCYEHSMYISHIHVWVCYSPNWLKTCVKGKRIEETEIYGAKKNFVVVELFVYVFGFRYLTPPVSSYTILFRWRLLVCEGCKGRKGRKTEREDIFLILTLFLSSTTILWLKSYPLIQMKWLHLPDMVLKYTNCFLVDISITRCFSRSFLVTETAARGDRVLRQVRDLLQASNREKEGPFNIKGKAEVKKPPPSSHNDFRACAVLTSSQGPPETSAVF